MWKTDCVSTEGVLPLPEVVCKTSEVFLVSFAVGLSWNILPMRVEIKILTNDSVSDLAYRTQICSNYAGKNSKNISVEISDSYPTLKLDLQLFGCI